MSDNESTEVQIARLQEQVRSQQVDIDASRMARAEYIPRIQAIEGGIGSLAMGMSDLGSSMKSLEATMHRVEERIAVPETQSAAMWKERARVLKYVSAILSAIIISVAVWLITEAIKDRQERRLKPIAPITGTVTGTSTGAAK